LLQKCSEIEQLKYEMMQRDELFAELESKLKVIVIQS
jgi:hypothetical protein